MEKQRIITAAIALPLLLLFLWLGGVWLGALLAVLAGIGCWEYARLMKTIPMRQPHMWALTGFLYIVLGFIAFYGVRAEGGVVWQLAVIWSTDIAAYEVGRRYGRIKLAPAISPNKTVEGALAGLAAGIILGTGYAALVLGINFIPALLISAAVSIIGQAGDLAESQIKRFARVKDSGSILPGHGGILDRFDSILLSSMFMYLFLLFIK